MKNSILIQNVYHMLSYAFQVLNKNGYKNIKTETFENTADMFAAIIQKGVESQLKRYLNRDYVTETEVLSTLRGKVRITKSINQMSFLNKKYVCSYDEFSIDSYMNRILKTTMLILLKADIASERKHYLKSILQYFSQVQEIDAHCINWKFHFNQNNQTYRMLMGICYLTLNGLLLTQSSGKTELMDFLDEQQMCRLYEKFVLEYYRKHFPSLHPTASTMNWVAEGETQYLPTMKTDITLTDSEKILIIDTKYYNRTMQNHYDKTSYHSGNICQIFSYVKNKEGTGSRKEVSGMLLYAKTDENITPDQTFSILGNQFSVRTLDLNVEFKEIKKQLDDIAKDKFSIP